MITHNRKLAFFFEENDKDIYSGRKIDLDAYYYACKAFGINQISVINLTKQSIHFSDESICYEVFSSFSDFRSKYESDKLILTEVPWAIPAESYKITKDIPDFDWIVIGPSNGWIPQPENVYWLTVPQNGKGALHSQHITTLILGFLFLARK